jgi:nucleoside-triphosphatase
VNPALSSIKNLIVAGSVGSGKTTLVKEVTKPFLGNVGGFLTEEIREDNERRGFRLRTLSPQGAKDAGVLAAKGLKSAAKIGKYGVDLSVLESAGVESLAAALSAPDKVIVADEIGAMETLSASFRSTLAACLASPRPVLATIRLRSQPFTDELKRTPRTKILVLTRENFYRIKEMVFFWLKEKAG